jgi:hypothetical protein
MVLRRKSWRIVEERLIAFKGELLRNKKMKRN